jgi:hypothetical protein
MSDDQKIIRESEQAINAATGSSKGQSLSSE